MEENRNEYCYRPAEDFSIRGKESRLNYLKATIEETLWNS
jgi:hypothetical protein